MSVDEIVLKINTVKYSFLICTIQSLKLTEAPDEYFAAG